MGSIVYYSNTFSSLLSLLLLTLPSYSSPINEGPFLPGPCPPVSPLPHLDLSLYQGRWRQVTLFPNVTSPLVGSGYGPDLTCVTPSYQVTREGLTVTNTGWDTETQQQVTITGSILDKQEELVLHLDTQELPDEEYQVLDTDYENFASVWNCKEFPMYGILVRREFAWILGREEIMESIGKMSEEVLETAVDAFRIFDIDVDKF